MKDFLLYASVVALFLVCILVVLVILMQRPSANAGMGSALGGGAVESVLGGGAAEGMSWLTTVLTVILFVLSFGLYLGFVAREHKTPTALSAQATTPDTKATVNKVEPAKAASVPAAATPVVPAATPAAKPAATPAPSPAPANKAEPVKSAAPAAAK